MGVARRRGGRAPAVSEDEAARPARAGIPEHGLAPARRGVREGALGVQGLLPQPLADCLSAR